MTRKTQQTRLAEAEAAIENLEGRMVAMEALNSALIHELMRTSPDTITGMRAILIEQRAKTLSRLADSTPNFPASWLQKYIGVLDRTLANTGVLLGSGKEEP